jgi:hypothetical protein
MPRGKTLQITDKIRIGHANPQGLKTFSFPDGTTCLKDI